MSDDRLGGYPDASVEATSLWYSERLEKLSLIEVRGRIKLDEDPIVTTSTPTESEEQASEESVDEEVGTSEPGEDTEDSDRKKYGLPRLITRLDGRRIDTRQFTARTIKKELHFTCGHCGLEQPLNESLEHFVHGAPIAVYAIQCYCPECDAEGRVYKGRFFASFASRDEHRLVSAEDEWHKRRDADLTDCWPREEIAPSYMTHHANFALPKQGYTNWWKMFNSRQLLVHTQIAKFIREHLSDKRWSGPALQALGAHQQYLRNQCMFAFWHAGRDHFAPHFGNPNYSPKNNVIEVGLWTRGYGSWSSTISSVIEGAYWAQRPWEPFFGTKDTTKSERVEPGDRGIV